MNSKFFKNNSRKKKKGFTLIEILIVVAISTILSGISFSSYVNHRRAKLLEFTKQEIVGYLRYAQQKSISQEGGNQWGIHFENPDSGDDFYALYHGTTYSSSEGTRYLPKGLEFQSPSSGNTIDISFSKLTGENYSEAEQEVIIDLTNNQIARVIRIMTNGVMTSGEGEKGYWKFDDGSGNSASDETIYKNTGTFAGSPTWKVSSNCISGTCLEFNGAQYINVSDDSNLDISNLATIEFWFYSAAFLSSYAAHPINKWPGTADANYVLYYFGNYNGVYPNNEGILRFYANAGGAWKSVSPAYKITTLHRWYHIVWVYDSTVGGKLYVDGSQISGTVGGGSLANNDSSLKIGGDTGDFNGRIDQVHIYNRALSAEEILQHYKARK